MKSNLVTTAALRTKMETAAKRISDAHRKVAEAMDAYYGHHFGAFFGALSDRRAPTAAEAGRDGVLRSDLEAAEAELSDAINSMVAAEAELRRLLVAGMARSGEPSN